MDDHHFGWFQTTIKDDDSGGNRDAGSTSLEAILVTLIPTFTTAVLFILSFLAVRAVYKNIYTPRTYLDIIPEKDKTPTTRQHGRHWFRDFINFPDHFLLQHQSLDTYLYLRFFKLIIAICFIGCCITWPILFPVNATGGGKSTQLDKISFSNIAGASSRLWAHASVAWVYFGIIMFLVARERLFVVGARQAYLSSKHEVSRLSSRTVLFLDVPEEATQSDNLSSIFGSKAKKMWVVSDISEVEDAVAKRNDRAMSLESAEITLIKNANRKRLRHSNNSANGNDSSKWIDKTTRPTHRLPTKMGTKVDSIEWSQKTLPDLASKVESTRKDVNKEASKEGTSSSVFIEFETQADALRAFHDVDFHKLLPIKTRYIGVRPNEVLWKSLSFSTVHRTSRSSVATAFVIAAIIWWSIPIGIVGAISNVGYLSDRVKFLRWINDLPPVILGALTGLLPPFVVSTFVSYVPDIFRSIARSSGEPTTSQAELKTQAWFFIFQVIQVFLVTTFSSGAAAVGTKIAQDPSSTPILLAQNLPKASNFYLSYFLIQGLSYSAKNVFNASNLFTYIFYDKFMDKTPRDKYNTYTRMKGIGWGKVYPKFTNMLVIAIVYSCIAPLVLGFATIGLFCYYLSYRYNLFYVIQPKIDSRGECYARALQQMTTGIYIAELCLIGLFTLRKATGPTTFVLVLFVVTIIYHFILDRLLEPIKLYPAIDSNGEAAPLLAHDEWATSDEPVLPGQKLGIPLLPAIISDPIAAIFESRISAARDKVKSILMDPTARTEEDPPEPPPTEDDLQSAYLHPAMTSKTPKLWLVKDEMGISKHLIEENEAIGVSSTDQGAWLDDKNHIKWDMDDFGNVPIFKRPVRY